MGKQQTNTASGQAEISVFAFTIKGDGTVVTNALQTLAKQGVTFQQVNGGTPKPPMVALTAPPANVGDDAEVGEALHVPEPVEASMKPARKRSGFAVPKIVDSLRAHESPNSFKEFVGVRALSSDMEKVVVAAMWMREHRHVEKFTVNEIFTCWRMLGWVLPNDPGQPMRNATKATLQYLRSEGEGMYSLTSGGLKKYAEIT